MTAATPSTRVGTPSFRRRRAPEHGRGRPAQGHGPVGGAACHVALHVDRASWSRRSSCCSWSARCSRRRDARCRDALPARFLDVLGRRVGAPPARVVLHARRGDRTAPRRARGLRAPGVAARAAQAARRALRGTRCRSLQRSRCCGQVSYAIRPALAQTEAGLGISLAWTVLAVPVGFLLLIYHIDRARRSSCAGRSGRHGHERTPTLAPLAAPRGGAVRARDGPSRVRTPTLAPLPPEGAQSVAWGGPAPRP